MQINNIGNNRVSFGSHLTKSFLKVIENTDVKAVEKNLLKSGIKADFKGNKNIASCVEQTVKIFKALNLDLPKQVTALKMPLVNGKSVNGSANIKLKVQFNTDIFNDMKWYDELNTMGRQQNLVSTDHFLMTFLHEFIHNDNFCKMKKFNKGDLQDIFNKINSMTPSYKTDDYILKKFRFYPQRNFFEIFADVMTSKIAKVLDNKTLMPKSNPFTEITGSLSNSKLSQKDICLNRILKSIYTGDVKSLSRIDIK